MIEKARQEKDWVASGAIARAISAGAEHQLVPGS
jgi:hypothetical protein